MRTRKEIEEQQAANVDSSTLLEAVSAQILLIHTEVLLDIRELLMNPPVEITHTPVSENKSPYDAWAGPEVEPSEDVGIPLGCCKECAYYLDYKDDWQCNGGVDGGNCRCHPDLKKDSVEEGNCPCECHKGYAGSRGCSHCWKKTY